MGEVMTEFRCLSWRGLLPTVLGIAVLVGGCASSSTGQITDEVTGAEPVSMDVAENTALSLQSLDLDDAAPGAVLALHGDGPLVWTSYRDPDGELIIELPNTILDPAVSSLDVSEGLVSAVVVMAEANAGRPLTRLKVSTRGESEHTVISIGNDVEIRFAPLGVDLALVASASAEESAKPSISLSADEPDNYGAVNDYESEVVEPMVVADASASASDEQIEKRMTGSDAPGIGLGTPEDP